MFSSDDLKNVQNNLGTDPSLNTLPEHNGWTNQPTWASTLWLQNDEFSSSMTQKIIRDAITANEDDAEKAVQTLAQNLKDYITEHCLGSLKDQASMAGDMVLFAINQIDFNRLALTYIEDEMGNMTMAAAN